MTSILVVLPDSPQPDYTWSRIRRACDAYFKGPDDSKTFAARSGSAALAAEGFGTVVAFHPDLFATAEIVVASEELIDQLSIPTTLRHYVLEHREWNVCVRLRNQQMDSRDYAHIDAHTFTRNAGKSGYDHIQFFPYGFLFRECGVGGPLDAFGFRHDVDPRDLMDRPPGHKLIVVLGGSAAWSYLNFHDEAFTFLLQRALQSACEEAGNSQTITVLNFGQAYGVILNEIITYLLHAERLRPDLVISHDGANDVLLGLSSDPYLLMRDICSPYYFEAWAQKLHDRSDVQPRIPPGQPLPVLNVPRNVIRAYINRKLQLDRMVRASGARHIAALQPYARSKKSSKLEAQNLKDPRYTWLWGETYDKFPIVFEQLSQELAGRDDIQILDLHRAIANADPEETLFQDFIHTTPSGERHISRIYASHILDNGLI
jgi:hypothetical protein